MNLAPVDYITWLSENSAAWCHRLTATITVSACLQNMYLSEGKETDCRCSGCGGLDNQTEPDSSFLPPVMIEEPEIEESPVAIPDSDEPEPDFDLTDFEDDEEEFPVVAAPATNLNSFDKKLLALLNAELEEDKPEPAPVKQRKRRFAVFMGRCPRCNGYMQNVVEAGDDEVYHCLACGWRTSPEYEQNRLYTRQERRLPNRGLSLL